MPKKIFGRVCLIFSIILLALFFWVVYDLPHLHSLLKKHRTPAVTLLYRDGSPLAFYGEHYGQPLHIKELPHHVYGAVVSIEDRRFFSHFGFDPQSFLRALWANLRKGSVAQGGSTITQQVAKNVLMSSGHYKVSDRSLKRKLQELMLVIWLEAKLSKSQILSLYLNRVYLGAGAYGFEAAARTYFGKSARHLSSYEAAVLAGMLKKPSEFSPFFFPKEAHQRALVVLKTMEEGKILTAVQRQKAATSLDLSLIKKPKAQDRFFADAVMSDLQDLIGQPGVDLEIWTTLDRQLQARAHRVMDVFKEIRQKQYKSEECAILCSDTTGAIRALVGGVDYWVSPFNRATQAVRQPGSLFKIFVYLTALEKGIALAASLEDSPLTINGWSPRNFDRQFRGAISLQDAFAYSVNVATVRLAQQVSIQSVIDMARRLGIKGFLPKDLSLALGTGSVTLEELVGAMTSIAVQGQKMSLYKIKKIIRLTDKKILYMKKDSSPDQVLSSSVVSSAHTLLRSVTEYGTAKSLRGFHALGKTGTTQDHKDAWFVGGVSPYILGVWIGNDDNRPMKKISGGGLPVLLWKEFFKK